MKIKNTVSIRNDEAVRIVAFSNKTGDDKKLLKKFVNFHWEHYRDDPQYIPLFNFEYMGMKLLGFKGYFEPGNLFFKHAEIIFFLAYKQDKISGRCFAFTNSNHNKHWNDKVGFFGEFETIDDREVSGALLKAAESWLKSKNMDTIRGPQNLLVNEATPGLMTHGFDSRPVVHYHYNKPYYEKLLLDEGFSPVKRVFSWEVPVMNPMEERLERVAKKVIERFKVTVEPWGERPFEERRREMFEVYNEAWIENFGFVPFTREEFYAIADDMKLVMDNNLSLFLYVKGELAAFFGGLPNIAEKMVPIRGLRRCDILRTAKMILTKGSVKGFRVGYLGIRKKFRRLGLDGVMGWKQKIHSQQAGYEYCDMGWVLEDNTIVFQMVDFIQAKLSKIYTIFQKPIL